MPPLPDAIRTHYDFPVARNTTSIRLPDGLIDALDRRAAALGITRSQLIVEAVEQALAHHSRWSPEFLEAIGTPRPDLAQVVDEMMHPSDQ